MSRVQGLAYMGEYPLTWAAFLCNEGVYNLLLDKGADPDAQDTYGNTVLHMVVVAAQLGMYGYALRHPRYQPSIMRVELFNVSTAGRTPTPTSRTTAG